MRCFACLLALGLAGGSVLGCGSSNSVDYFSGSGGSGAVSRSNTASAASAGQSPAGGTSFGGSVADSEQAGGPSSGGAASTAAGSSAAGSSSAGSSSGNAGAPSTGACAPVADIGSGMSFASAGPLCLRVTLDIAGWGCSNFDGRTVKVNGTTVSCGDLPLPSKLDGAYYFDVSAGEHDYASLYWY